MNKNREHILLVLKRLKRETEQHGIDRLGLFGSYASGEDGPHSDIDIVIRTTERFVQMHGGFEAFSYLESLRQAISGEFEGASVDICDLAGLEKKQIVKDAIYV